MKYLAFNLEKIYLQELVEQKLPTNLIKCHKLRVTHKRNFVNFHESKKREPTPKEYA